MKKFFVSFGFIIIFVANIFYQRLSGANTNFVASDFSAIPQNTDKKLSSPIGKTITSILPRTIPLVKTNQPAVTQITSSPTQASTPAPTQTSVSTASQGQYRDGTYTGAAADASYGTVQVAAVITSGKLADINFLSYPNDRQHSVQVSSYALPILRQEAIAVQSAKIDTVSGASYTSAAFKESLGSALNQAL